MAQPAVKAILAAGMACGLLLWCAASWALEIEPYKEETPLLSTNELPSKATAAEAAPTVQEKPESFRQFLTERTQIGYGWEGEYNDNIFLKDNNRQDDFINTIEGVLFFNDPRGALLYGSQWEVNAFRYMYHNLNAINHDVVSYIDYDTGKRWQFHFTHYLNADNHLVFGSPGVDILRVTSDFQRSVEHRFEPRIRYNINDEDALIGRINYSLFDDQAAEDADTDRKTFRSTLDWNHDLTRVWSVYAGALYENQVIPGDKLKSSNSYGGRLGSKYELTRTEALKALVELEFPQTRTQKRISDFNYTVSWAHTLGPRTDFELGLTDTRRTSFISGRTDFRSRAPTFKLNYLLTPLVTASFHGLYERQKSTNSGPSSSLEENKLWDLGLDLTWQVRQQVRFHLFLSYGRSPTRDYTNRIVHMQLEGTI